MSKIVKAGSAEELQKIASEAQGPVVLEFKSDDCGACIAEQPNVEKLANKCAQATVIQVDVDQCADVADAWGIEAMPTLFVAQKGSDLQPGKAREVEDSAAAAKLLKCPR